MEPDSNTDFIVWDVFGGFQDIVPAESAVGLLAALPIGAMVQQFQSFVDQHHLNQFRGAEFARRLDIAIRRQRITHV